MGSFKHGSPASCARSRSRTIVAAAVTSANSHDDHDGARCKTKRQQSREALLLHATGNLPSIASEGLKPSVQRVSRCRARAQDAGCDLEAVVEREALVEQKLCGGQVALRRIEAPATLLPADERRAYLFHDASVADCRLARPVCVMCHALVV